ncbi:DUF4269 domain-containing protein [Paenibacillus sp. RRE4]|uniref:DUF4269 domain-containing protein n=1 Tax=Paenibacillus sp. RRE4 TaxID=2962587 RepID=UPI0028826DF7|nr:DUF4269 domain-containing protein [Paenibacillus sp. RRE4]MDT0122150.1 DUF4269 domain-containing protein [Paenibacillus sp. RRE4]
MSVSGRLDTTEKVMKHLSVGDQQQQDAYRVLHESRLLLTLSAHAAYPAGTVPIDVYLPDSDLDILCYSEDLNAFQVETSSQLESIAVNGSTEWTFGDNALGQNAYITCKLRLELWPVEIFAQATPVDQQNAYLHMQVEWSLLQLWGEAGQREIRRLKQAGWKTEPAFARVLGLEGDPYIVMRELASLQEPELWDFARSRVTFK